MPNDTENQTPEADATDERDDPTALPSAPSETAPAVPETSPVAATPEPEAVALPHVAVGDIVHVALDRGPLTGECRPAIVVRVFGGAVVNVQMFSDGVNDHQDYAGGLAQLTGLHFALPVEGQPTTPQTWHQLTHE